MSSPDNFYGELAGHHDPLLSGVTVLMPIGGTASRARAITHDAIPKHLIELGDGRPVLDFVLQGLQQAGFTQFVFCVGQHKEQITDHITREDWVANDAVSYDFSVEKELLGVDGAIMRAISTMKLSGQGMFVPGDMLLPWAGLAAMNVRHKQRGADVTLGVTSHVTERTTDVGRKVVEDETDRLLWCYGRTEEPAGDRPGSRGLTSAAAITFFIERYSDLCEAYLDSHPEHGSAPLSFRDNVAPWAVCQPEFSLQAFDVAGEALDLGTPANIYYGQTHWKSYV